MDSLLSLAADPRTDAALTRLWETAKAVSEHRHGIAIGRSRQADIRRLADAVEQLAGLIGEPLQDRASAVSRLPPQPRASAR